MPTGKHVKLIIRGDGSCIIDAVNFEDASCLSVTEEITTALGGDIDHQRHKPEARIRRRCGVAEKERA